MYSTNITHDYDYITFTNCTNNENEEKNIVIEYLLFMNNG